MKAIAAGVLCAALAGCAAWGGEKTVALKERGFQISFPEAWKKFGHALWDSPDGDAYAYVEVADLKEGESLRSFFKSSTNREWFKDATLVTLDVGRLDGVPAIKLVVDDKPPRRELRILIYYVVAGGRSYGIWMGGPKADFEKHAKEFDAIVKSFKLLKTE